MPSSTAAGGAPSDAEPGRVQAHEAAEAGAPRGAGRAARVLRALDARARGADTPARARSRSRARGRRRRAGRGRAGGARRRTRRPGCLQQPRPSRRPHLRAAAEPALRAATGHLPARDDELAGAAAPDGAAPDGAAADDAERRLWALDAGAPPLSLGSIAALDECCTRAWARLSLA